MTRLMWAAQLLNPQVGDHTDLLLKIMIVVGALCLLSIVALLILPKKSKKEDTEEEQIEVINEQE